MANVACPYSELFREPNLLIHKKKPIVPIKADLTHKQLDGCVSWWPLIQGGGRDIIGQHHATYNGDLVKGGNWRSAPSSISSDSTGLSVPDHGDFTLSALTVMVSFRATGFGGENSGLISQYNSGGGTSRRSWALAFSKTGRLLGYFSNTGDYQSEYDLSGSIISLNTTYTAAMTWDSSSAYLYLNGVEDGEDTSASASLYNSSMDVIIGGPFNYELGDSGAVNRVMIGDLYWARFYNKKLSQSMIKEIHDDPWAPAIIG